MSQIHTWVLSSYESDLKWTRDKQWVTSKHGATGEQKRKLRSFDTMSLHRILWYRWQECMSNDLVLRKAGLQKVICIASTVPLRGYDSLQRTPPTGFCLVGIWGAGPAQGAPACFVVAPGGVLSEEYGRGWSSVCLGDGQTEADGVPSQCGRNDALRTPLHFPIPDLTWPECICMMHWTDL